MFLMFTVFTCHSQFVQADDTAVVAAQPAPQEDGGQKIVEGLQAAEKKIPAAIPAWLLGSIIFAIELGARAVPTAKPKSLLLLISTALSVLGSMLTKLSSLLDSLLQNVKSE
jgi:hypothetical protein